MADNGDVLMSGETPDVGGQYTGAALSVDADAGAASGGGAAAVTWSPTREFTDELLCDDGALELSNATPPASALVGL